MNEDIVPHKTTSRHIDTFSPCADTTETVKLTQKSHLQKRRLRQYSKAQNRNLRSPVVCCFYLNSRLLSASLAYRYTPIFDRSQLGRSLAPNSCICKLLIAKVLI